MLGTSTKGKARLVHAIAFVVNTALAVGVIFLGMFLRGFKPGPGDVATGTALVALGILLVVMHLIAVLRRSFAAYLMSVLATLATITAWIGLEGSMDAALVLPVYILIFAPATIYLWRIARQG